MISRILIERRRERRKSLIAFHIFVAFFGDVPREDRTGFPVFNEIIC